MDPKFGKKVVCQNCTIKFYTLGKKDPKCPSCGQAYMEDQLLNQPVQNLQQSANQPTEKKPTNLKDIEEMDTQENDEDSDIISLDEQASIEETEENLENN